ncbi:MAG: IS200/IS605 family transposase [Candidatus Methanoperedens sp.]|nr:IS200/IS605 family transposase [Candidatus Methanoperedens sp.]PKL52733.1 MAG: IS200/IS605 family transposase [Candidatus Methanoperedenaceae archaeon HGW-Methanoperedenaceae-1]
MVELEHASHCVYQIRYHMVFCIIYIKKLLFDNDIIEFFKEICLEIGKRYWFKFDAIGTDGDHVHVFVGAAPRYAPSNIMQIIKSITAKKIFGKYPGIKKQLWGGQFWSEGGYIGTVGDGVTADIIKRYVEEQGTTEEKEGYCQMKLLDFG